MKDLLAFWLKWFWYYLLSLKAKPLFLQQWVGRAGYASTDLHRQVSRAAPVTPLSSCLPAPASSRQWTACPAWTGTLEQEGQAWAEAQGTWLPHCLPLHLAREFRQTDHSLCSNQWQWAMFCLTPFLKARNVSRPFWETGSGCYGSLHCPFLNCGNHGNKSRHSCWCTTPMTLANAPRKRRKDHKNEQDWTIWVHTMAFCKRAGRAQILSQSLFMCILQKQSPWTQTLGLTDLSGKLMQLHMSSLFMHWWPRAADMFTVHKNVSLNKRNLKANFVFMLPDLHWVLWQRRGELPEPGHRTN